MNSRDEQGKIVDIYRRIEDRSEDIIQHLQQRIFHLESTIEAEVNAEIRTISA